MRDTDRVRGMTSAFTQEGFLSPEGPPGPVGVIVTRDFPESEFAIEALRRAPETAFFVVRETDRVTRALVERAGLEERMLLMPLNPYWRLEGSSFDHRRQMRDCDIRACCDFVLLFRKKGEKSTDSWLPDPSRWWVKDQKVRLIERGSEPVKRRRKGRVPVGAR